MSRSPGHASDLPSTPKIKVNFAPAEDLRLIPGVGSKLANAIMTLRESLGNLDSATLNVLLRRPLNDTVLYNLDFSPNPALSQDQMRFTDQPQFGPLAWEAKLGAVGGGAPLTMQEGLDSKELAKLHILQNIEKMERDIGRDIPWTEPIKAGRREQGATLVSQSAQSSRLRPRNYLFDDGYLDSSFDKMESNMADRTTNPQTTKLGSNMAAKHSSHASDTKMASSMAASHKHVAPAASMASTMAASYTYTPVTTTNYNMTHRYTHSDTKPTNMSSMTPRYNIPQSNIMASTMADNVSPAHQSTTSTSGTSSSYTVRPTVTNFMSDMATGYAPVHSESKMAPKMAVSHELMPTLVATRHVSDHHSNVMHDSSGEEYMGVAKPTRKNKSLSHLHDTDKINKSHSGNPRDNRVQSRRDQESHGSSESSDEEQTHARVTPAKSRSDNSKSKAKSRSDDSDSKTNNRQPKSAIRKSALQNAPKLTYDGTDDWEIFRDKFQDYTEQMNWTPNECKACLKWCLRGKAAKFCNALLKTNDDIMYTNLLKKMGERFGDDDARAAKQALFNQAVQKKDEAMDDWADRVQELASKAFVNLPDDYCRGQAVQKFCEGLLDSEAGHHVITQEPSTLEQAVKRTRLYQHTKGACYKSKPKRDRTPRVTAEDYDETPEVCAVGQQSDMAAVLKEMMEQRKLLEKVLLQNRPTRKPGGVPWNECYECHEKGHRKRDCPKLKNKEALNQTGSSLGAMARTQEGEGPNKSSH